MAATPARDRRAQLRFRLVLVALGIAGCHGGGDRGGAGRPDADGGATLQRWATWPMPNSTAGLPNPQSFDVSRDDVALDRVTGLMWQRKLVDDPRSFADAGQACETLTLAGYDDWRLPSRIELVSILNLARVQPAVDLNVFPETPSDWFWTSSHAAGDDQSAWYVYFYFGYPNTELASSLFPWRCVRTAAPRRAPPSPRYDIQQDTVRDVATGLVWQRSLPEGVFTWEGAVTYCARLRLGNQPGWRLPSMTELLTLVDETAPTAPAIDTNAFPVTPSAGFWSGSEFGGAHGMAWQVYFDRGNGLYGLTDASFRVRCVQ